MKTIVMHIGPDLDAMSAAWMVKTFFPGWEEADFAFVPAGKTYKDLPPDDNPDIIHVDTGFGKFDHHNTDADICAARLVYEEIARTTGENPALDRMTRVVNEIDHFREVFFPEPTNDIWDVSIVSAIDGWRLLYSENPVKIVQMTFDALDGIYKTFQNKLWAEEELKKNGKEFPTKWGKGFAVETTNDEVVHLGQKMGYAIVIRKDSRKGYLRIKSLPKPEIDLTAIYDKLKAEEPSATWFLHASKHMILNGSSKNPDFRPSKKTVDEVIVLFSSE